MVIRGYPMDLERLAKNASIEKFSQLEAAERQIDRAVSLFINEKDYISAITLAGAAEGILGEAQQKARKQYFFGILREALKKMPFLSMFKPDEISELHLNRIRNFLKHYSGDLKKQIEHPMDLEAIQLLVRAIASYGFLTNTVTKGSVEFFGWLREHRPEILEESVKINDSFPKLL